MSIVEQNTAPAALREHAARLRSLERSGSIWIYVGTLGQDGVDALLTPDSRPFQNGWTNTLGDDAPVSFTIINGWVHIRGGFFGGPNNSVVFTLPIGYRPEFQQQMIIPTSDLAHYATCAVMPTGDVIFGVVI